MDFFEEILNDEPRFLRVDNVKKIGEFAEMIFSLATDLDYLYFGVKGKERKNKNGEYVVPDVKKYREKVKFRQMQISKRYKVLRKKFLAEEKQVTETACQTDRNTSSVGSSQTIITNAILKGMIEKNEPVEVSGISTQTEVPESPFVQKPISKTNFPSLTNARGRGRGRGRGGLYRPSSRLDSSNIGFDKMESEVKKPEKAGRPDSNIGNSSLVFEEALPEPEKTVQENPAAKKRLIRPKDEEFERYEPEVVERTFTSLDKFQRNPSSNAKPIPREFKPYQQELEISNKENVPFCAKEEDFNKELPKVQAASTVGARGDSTLISAKNSTVAPTIAVEENEDDLTKEEGEPRESSKDFETPDVKISSEKEMSDKKIDDSGREEQMAENNEEDLKSETEEEDYVEEQKSLSSDSDRDDLTTEQKELMDDVNRVANMPPSEVDTDFSDEEIVPAPVQTQEPQGIATPPVSEKLPTYKETPPLERSPEQLSEQDSEEWEVGTLSDRKVVWKRMLGNLWKYECRSIALDKLDSRGQEFKTIFEETRNKLIRDPDEVISDEETFTEFCENKDDSNNNGLNKLDKTKACRVICFYIGTKNVLKTTRFTKFVIQKIEMTFKKNIYKLFLEAKFEDKESLFTEKNVMKMREKIKDEILKLSEYFLCKGGKWINICKAISVTEESSKNDGFRISDHSANDSDDSDAAQRREMERNLRELESDENRQIERIDEIWQSMISAEAELPYGYFDAIAATTEFSMVEELEFENVLMFHNDDDFVMEGANMKPVKKALMNISAAVGKSNIFNHIYLYKPDIIKYLEGGETWQTLKNLGLSPFIWAVNLTPAPEKEIVGDLVDIWKLEQPLDKAGNIDWMDEEDWEEYVLKCECVP